MQITVQPHVILLGYKSYFMLMERKAGYFWEYNVYKIRRNKWCWRKESNKDVYFYSVYNLLLSLRIMDKSVREQVKKNQTRERKMCDKSSFSSLPTVLLLQRKWRLLERDWRLSLQSVVKKSISWLKVNKNKDESGERIFFFPCKKSSFWNENCFMKGMANKNTSQKVKGTNPLKNKTLK